MDFALRIESAAVTARALAESLMEDRVRVWRSTGQTGHDEWGHVAGESVVVYEGRAKLQNDASYPSSPDVGDQARLVTQVSQVHFPYGTLAVQSGDVVEVVRAKNPRLSGVRVRVRSDVDKTWSTAARFNVVEVLSGADAG